MNEDVSRCCIYVKTAADLYDSSNLDILLICESEVIMLRRN